jgi:hypothetical protein
LLQADPESSISIEKLDDVAFEDDGEPSELLQFKHRLINSPTLTDYSTDLWKTLRVWATAAKEGSLHLTSVILSLVTTASAPVDSVASLRDGPRRNEDRALKEAPLGRSGFEESPKKGVLPGYSNWNSSSEPRKQRMGLKIGCCRKPSLIPGSSGACPIVNCKIEDEDEFD